MDDLLDYFEGLPRLDVVGLCPVGFRDVYRRFRPGVASDVIEAEFEEYAAGYRECLRRAEWDA